MFARSFTKFAARQSTQAVKARAFSTANRAAAGAAPRFAAYATAGAVATAAASYAYMQTPIYADAKPIAGVKGTFSERTFIAVKPDGVHRGLVGKVIQRFEDRGYKLVGLKQVVPSRDMTKNIMLILARSLSSRDWSTT
ncbi:unnamed protein product [Absidia cylindrospora]